MLASVEFLADLPLYEEEQPYEIHGFPDKGAAMQTNCVMEAKTVQVEDARSRESDFTLDGCGFTFFRHTSQCNLEAKYFEYASEGNSVVDSYLAETMEMVKEKFAASKAILFDWRVSKDVFLLSFPFLFLFLIDWERPF
jgi:hypothetical protein